jgi:hypothetical protein
MEVYVPPKYCYPPTGPHGITSQKSNMNMTAFWDTAQCSPIEDTSETSVYLYETTRRNIPDTGRREILKSHICVFNAMKISMSNVTKRAHVVDCTSYQAVFRCYVQY